MADKETQNCKHEYYLHADSYFMSNCSLGTCNCEICKECGGKMENYETS